MFLLAGTPVAIAGMYFGVRALDVTLAADPLAIGVVGVLVSVTALVGLMRVVPPPVAPPRPEPRARVFVQVTRKLEFRRGAWFFNRNRVFIEYTLRAELRVGDLHFVDEEIRTHRLHATRDAEQIAEILAHIRHFGERQAHRWAAQVPDHDVVYLLPEEDLTASIREKDLPRLPG